MKSMYVNPVVLKYILLVMFLSFQQRIQMMVNHGKEASHLSEVFPECTPFQGTPREPPEGWLELKADLEAAGVGNPVRE